MAFCGNCGLEVPEGMKFCPNCGTAVFDLNSINTAPDDDLEIIDTQIEDMQARPQRDVRLSSRIMQAESDLNTPRRRKGKQKRSVLWMVVAIVSIILSIVSWFIPSDVATWIILGVALAAAIVSLCKKAKFRAISIIAIVISGTLVFLWLIQGIIYLRSPHDPKEVNYGQVNVTIPAKYLAKVDESYDMDVYSTRDGNAAILIEYINQSLTEGQFNNSNGVINRAIRESLASEISITDSSASQYRNIGNFNSLVFQYKGQSKEGDVVCKVIFINNIAPQKSLILANMYAEKAEDKYGSDFNELIGTIRSGRSYSSSETNDSSSSLSSIFSSGGVDPQLKAALDEYEAFVDEYVSFMKKYQADPGNAIGMLSDYTSMLTRLAEFSEKIKGYDTTKMSKADYAYYLDVLNRVEKKMLDVAY